MEYNFLNRAGHIEVIDCYGRFVFSADTVAEARREIAEMETEEQK